MSAVNTVSGGSSTGIGAQALQALTSGGFNTSVGALSFSLLTTGVNNTGLGYQVGNETTGSNNIFIGYNTASTTTSGSNNIVIGYGIATPAVDSANTLNIGNLLFGTGINGEGTNLSTGNIGIGSTSPAYLLGMEASGGGFYDASTNDFTTGPSFSWLKQDRQVLSSADTFAILNATNIEEFRIIEEVNTFGAGADTHIGIILDEADPRLSTKRNGSITGFDAMRTASVAFRGVQLMSQVIDISGASTSTPSIYIDASGMVAIGTTTPDTSYALYVDGDVAATSFVNISTKEQKKDIEYLNEEDKRSITDRIRNIKVAEYRYAGEKGTAPLRLGLIAEEAPVEVLSANKKGVDVYKLATFILAGVQEQDKQITNLELRITNLEMLVGTSTPTDADLTQTFAERITTALGTLGAKITNGLVELKNLVVESLTTKKLCVDDVCVDKEQFKALLANAGITPSGNTQIPSTKSQTNPNNQNSNTQTDTIPPVLTVNGNNPANIAVGAVYNDLGASVSDNLDNNLGVKASLNNETWIEVGNLQLSTASSTTYTIYYRAIDNAGNEGRAQRVVNVGTGNTEVVVVPSASEPETATSTPVTTESAVEEPPSDSSTSALESLGTATSTQTVIEEPMGTEEATSTSVTP